MTNNDLDHDLRDTFRRHEQDVLGHSPTPSPSLFRRIRRRQTGTVLMAAVAAAAIAIAGISGLDAIRASEQTPAVPGGVTRPAETGPAETGAVGVVPKTDFRFDLDTGKMTQLPESIVGTEDGTAGYAVSPDGSEVAYHGHAEDGSVQVFVANLDGTHVRQITSNGAATMLWSGSPGWSPDGTRIAYVGDRTGDFTGRGFVIDLASGVTTQVTSDSEEVGGIQFSPDGSSILYTTWVPSTRRGPASGLPFVDHRVRIVPLTGGEATTIVSGDRTWDGWGGPTEARLSPDGSLLSYLCGNSRDDVLDLCVANADGSGARELASGEIMSASWSPDGTRIAYWVFHAVDVLVVDVTTGVSSYVTEGAHPVWLDDHTLIVEHDRCPGPAGSDGCGG